MSVHTQGVHVGPCVRGHWTVGTASEVEAMTERLDALAEGAETFEITDREYDLIKVALEATQGPQRIAMPFLRRLSNAVRGEGA